jgi:hypothetical protein
LGGIYNSADLFPFFLSLGFFDLFLVHYAILKAVLNLVILVERSSDAGDTGGEFHGGGTFCTFSKASFFFFK